MHPHESWHIRSATFSTYFFEQWHIANRLKNDDNQQKKCILSSQRGYNDQYIHEWKNN
jgi:hypothetical protein